MKVFNMGKDDTDGTLANARGMNSDIPYRRLSSPSGNMLGSSAEDEDILQSSTAIRKISSTRKMSRTDLETQEHDMEEVEKSNTSNRIVAWCRKLSKSGQEAGRIEIEAVDKAASSSRIVSWCRKLSKGSQETSKSDRNEVDDASTNTRKVSWCRKLSKGSQETSKSDRNEVDDVSTNIRKVSVCRKQSRSSQGQEMDMQEKEELCNSKTNAENSEDSMDNCRSSSNSSDDSSDYANECLIPQITSENNTRCEYRRGVLRRISFIWDKGWEGSPALSPRKAVRYIRRKISRKNSKDVGTVCPLVVSDDGGIPSDVATKEDILDRIMHLLNPADLFHCRLVNRQWEAISTAHLRRQMLFQFYKYKPNRLHENPLEQLTTFLQTCRTLDTFPCNEFSFEGRHLGDKSLQDFLDLYGSNITKLTIVSPKRHHGLESPELHENIVMEQVKQLLGRQVPNLECLKLDIHPIVEWKHDPSRHLRSPLKTTDSEYTKIHSEKFVQNVKLNENLRLFSFGGSTSSKVFEVIMVMAPNLERVLMQGDNYPFLMEPVNRLHYLKHLQLNGQETTCAKIKQTTFALSMKPRSMYSSFQGHFKVMEWLPPYESDIISTINMIFNGCANTLESIQWEPGTLYGEFYWPEVMPNVWQLQLGSPFDEGDREGIFPLGFDMAKTFPNLKTIGLFSYGDRKYFKVLLSYLKFDAVLSVRKIEICCVGFRGERISTVDTEPLRSLFPAAEIKIDELYKLKKRHGTHKVLIAKS